MDLTHRPPSTITHITQVDDTVTVVGQQAALLSAVAGDLQVGEGLMVVDEGDIPRLTGVRVAPDTSRAARTSAVARVVMLQGDVNGEGGGSGGLEDCRIVKCYHMFSVMCYGSCCIFGLAGRYLKYAKHKTPPVAAGNVAPKITSW